MKNTLNPRSLQSSSESGNILVYVLLGIVLLGLLTAALRQSGDQGKDLDQERLNIKAGQVQQYAAQIAQGVATMVEGGVSEAKLKFAHPDGDSDYGLISVEPTEQVFSTKGGNIPYKLPPAGVNDGSKWQFYGTTDIPQVGSDKAELIAVLPNVTKEFCVMIDRQLKLGDTPPVDDNTSTTPDCVGSLTAAHKFSGTYMDPPNELDPTTFSRLPMSQACVSCGASYHYFYVLLSR
jgi:hypothetical protein